MDKFPILEITPVLNTGGITKPSNLGINKNEKSYNIKTVNPAPVPMTNPFNIKDTFERSDKKDVNPEDNKNIGIKDIAIGCAESIPYVRRLMGVENGANNGDYVKAALAAAILFANVPEDFRDLKKAAEQIIHPEKVKASSIGYDFQPLFSFFRGTWFEFLLKGKGKYTGKISEFLYNSDQTLFQMPFFRKKILGIYDYSVDFTTREDVFKNLVRSYKVNEKSVIKKVLGGASMRVPIIGILAFSLLEMPSIVKAFSNSNNIKDNFNNGFKQTAKSFVNIVSILGWSAVLGWILHRYKGPAGSLLGIGLGTALGSKQAQIINDKIDVEI